MHYKITTLVENAVYGRNLQAEHGLSLLIENNGYKILFDTGQSDLFIHNATLSDIEIAEVNFLILSHGHSDHTGGLRHFLSVNKKASVICKQEALYRKFKDKRENRVIDSNLLDLSRFRFITGQTELIPGLFLFPDLPVINPEDTHFERFFTQTPEGVVPDIFNDELAVALIAENTYSVLSACSHRGITNILRTIGNCFPGYTFKLLAGGFHIHNAQDEKFSIIADYLKNNLPEQIGISHCTGIDKYALSRQTFGNRVFYNYTGNTFYL